MKHYIIVTIAAFAALNMSCSKNMENPSAGITTITATLANHNLKTVLGEDGESVLWSPKDEISVFYNEDGIKFTSINTQPKASTIFTSDSPIIYGGSEGTEGTLLYGLYPYNESNAQVGDKLTFSVPSSQTAVAGSFARGSFPSAGRSTDTNIAFYNVCGGVRFSLSQRGIWIIKFSGNNGEAIAGKARIRFDASGHPVVDEVLQGETSVTLSVPEGKEFLPGQWYYISLLPTALTKGFTIQFIKNEDDIFSANISVPVEIKRTTFGSLRNIDNNTIPSLVIEDLSEIPEQWSE